MTKLIDIINQEWEEKGAIPCIMLRGKEGHASFGAGRIGFDGDGSGWLANGNIQFDRNGNLDISGRLTSNNEGNRIIVDPSDRSVQLISSNNNILGKWYFYNSNTWEAARFELKSADTNGNTTAETTIVPAYIELETEDYKLEMEAARINIVGDSKQFRVSVDKTKTTLQLSLMNLPTSKKGLNSGDVWRDGENLKIVP